MVVFGGGSVENDKVKIGGFLPIIGNNREVAIFDQKCYESCIQPKETHLVPYESTTNTVPLMCFENNHSNTHKLILFDENIKDLSLPNNHYLLVTDYQVVHL